ncbi:hypothetical protein DFH09DRAFT_1102661 [Mycena vulgaris]|nr:hypothetical protein DFH09DRAFT_1102661 [Mycena vulgaris]
MTERLSLFHSFRFVKFEWSDLDGMRSVRRHYNLHPHAQLHLQAHPHQRPQQPAPISVSVPPPQPQASAFAVLTNARLASFSADDPICGRSMSSFTLSPVLSSTSSPFATLSPLPTPTPYSYSPTAVKTHTQPKKPKKARSPVKGLFAFPSPPSSCAPVRLQFPLLPNLNPNSAAANVRQKAVLHRLSPGASRVYPQVGTQASDRNRTTGDSATALRSSDFDLGWLVMWFVRGFSSAVASSRISSRVLRRLARATVTTHTPLLNAGNRQRVERQYNKEGEDQMLGAPTQLPSHNFNLATRDLLVSVREKRDKNLEYQVWGEKRDKILQKSTQEVLRDSNTHPAHITGHGEVSMGSARCERHLHSALDTTDIRRFALEVGRKIDGRSVAVVSGDSNPHQAHISGDDEDDECSWVPGALPDRNFLDSCPEYVGKWAVKDRIKKKARPITGLEGFEPPPGHIPSRKLRDIVVARLDMRDTQQLRKVGEKNEIARAEEVFGDSNPRRARNSKDLEPWMDGARLRPMQRGPMFERRRTANRRWGRGRGWLHERNADTVLVLHGTETTPLGGTPESKPEASRGRRDDATRTTHDADPSDALLICSTMRGI